MPLANKDCGMRLSMPISKLLNWIPTVLPSRLSACLMISWLSIAKICIIPEFRTQGLFIYLFDKIFAYVINEGIALSMAFVGFVLFAHLFLPAFIVRREEGVGMLRCVVNLCQAEAVGYW